MTVTKESRANKFIDMAYLIERRYAQYINASGPPSFSFGELGLIREWFRQGPKAELPFEDTDHRITCLCMMAAIIEAGDA